MVNISAMSANAYNAASTAATNAGTAIKGALTQKNEQTGKSEWNGKAVGLAVATGTAALATGIVVRYGADSSAILKGMQDDGSSALGAVKGGFDYTVSTITAAGTKASNAFTGVFNSDNATAAYDGLKALPGQFADSVRDIKDQASTNFNALMSKLNGIEAKIDAKG